MARCPSHLAGAFLGFLSAWLQCRTAIFSVMNGELPLPAGAHAAFGLLSFSVRQQHSVSGATQLQGSTDGALPHPPGWCVVGLPVCWG